MKDNKVFIRHILDEVNYIIQETKDLRYENLIANETLKRAFVRSLEIIGEATKNLSKDFRDRYSDINWKELAGLRDKLIHYYFGVDWGIVWDIMKNEIPQIENKLKAILEREMNDAD